MEARCAAHGVASLTTRPPACSLASPLPWIQSKEKVAIIGSGNWGSAIAKIIGRNVLTKDDFDDEVRMWVFEEQVDGRNRECRTVQTAWGACVGKAQGAKTHALQRCCDIDG